MGGRTRLAVAASAVLAITTGGCSSKVSGSISSEGGELGTFTRTPTYCKSGQHWGYFGAAFFVDDDDAAIADVVRDPVHGWFVKVGYANADKMIVLGSQQCSRLDVDVHETNSSVNQIRLVEGSARFDCTTEGGGHVTGQLDFEKCH